MENLYLIKIGEIALKGENRSYFEGRLRRNLRRALHGIECSVTGGSGRFTVLADSRDDRVVRDVLAATFGITSYSRAARVDKELDRIARASVELASGLPVELLASSFKVEARRSDKSFPLTSYEIAKALGARLLQEFPRLTVDVHNPKWTLNVEIRDRAFLYTEHSAGPGGLPVGCAGRGIVLLSGGIDSPVAGYLMAKRGLRLDAAYFHTYPYTSKQAEEKVRTLSRLLAPYLCGVNLFIVPFTECQLRIGQRAAAEEVTLLMRACMMRIAERLTLARRGGCLVTGESLSQVASQTTESIRFTGSVTNLPVFRPLIGLDKEEIITLARRIGTFETSILPYEDCCTIFSPRHPLIRPNFEHMQESLARLAIDELLEAAAAKAERAFFGPRP